MPSFPCAHPTCTTYVRRRGLYCEAHEQQGRNARRERDRFYDQHQRNPNARVFYNSAGWQRARAIKLAHNPTCERCCRAWARHVHHVKPITTPEGWERRLDQKYLKSLCPPCHNEEEAEAANGKASHV